MMNVIVILLNRLVESLHPNEDVTIFRFYIILCNSVIALALSQVKLIIEIKKDCFGTGIV